jgi:hypothetical protein
VVQQTHPFSASITVYCRDEGRMLVDCGHGDITAIDADAVLPTKKLEWRYGVLEY